MRLKHMAAIIGVAYGAIAIMPLFVGDTPFIMNILVMCLIWAVVASCWDVIMGGLAVILVLTLPKGVMGLFSKLFLAPDENG